MNWTRTIGLIVLLAAIVGALVYGFMPRAVAVDVFAVTRGPLRETIDEEGKTRVIDRFVVSAPVDGYARRLDYEVGDPVKKGGAVVALEPARSTALDPRSRAGAEARVAAAGAGLKSMREKAEAAGADLRLAAVELKRVRALYRSGYAARDAFDRALSDFTRASATHRSAGFSVDVAKFELEEARTALKYAGAGEVGDGGEVVEIRSPVDGQVLKILHKSEGPVVNGSPIVEIGDPRALEVEVDVLSEDSVRISPGTRVEFERWGGKEPLEGRVRVVEPAGFTKISALGVEEQRVWVISDFTSAAELWQKLGDGYRVEASFIIWEGKDVLQVPSSALFRHDSSWAAFVVENGRARLRNVGVGHRSGFSVEVTSGLKAGDKVITHPDESIGEGTRVRVRE